MFGPKGSSFVRSLLAIETQAAAKILGECVPYSFFLYQYRCNHDHPANAVLKESMVLSFLNDLS
jgi:hypothetical protein